MKKNELYESLPEQVQRQVSKALKGWREVDIWFENGKHHVSSGTCVKEKHADDYKVIGILTNDDIYTAEEQILYYAETFRTYPRSYHGRRDMELLSALTDDTPLEYDGKGNIRPKVTDAGARLAPDYFMRKVRDLASMKEQLQSWRDGYNVHGEPDAVKSLSDALAALKEFIDKFPLY